MPKETAQESRATDGAFVIWIIVESCSCNVYVHDREHGSRLRGSLAV